MADVSFTEMGQALDAATQLREPSNSVSSATQEPSPSLSRGGGSTDGEGTKAPGSAGASFQPPKTDDSPSLGADDGKGASDGRRANAEGKPSGTADNAADDKANVDADAERRKYNRWQAAKRIASKESKRRQFEQERERLVRERDAYSDEKGQSHNPTLAQVKEDQIRELDIKRMREAQAEWEQEAREIFTPEDAETFIEDSRNLADWINTKEPELSAYLDKPYGKHLLKGWMDKVAKNKEAAQQWQSLTPFQKNQVVDGYYKQLEKFGEDYAAGKIDENGNPIRQTPPANVDKPDGTCTSSVKQDSKPADVPVPNSGRDSKTIPPSDNFGLMLQDAMNKRNLPLNRGW